MLGALAALLLAGCGQPDRAAAPTAAPTRAAFQAATLLPEATAMPSPPPTDPAATPIDSALTPFVDQAKADLAQRQGAEIASIAVIEARSVTWPDPGLGCPQPGMAYKQVPVDGLLIRLSLGGKTFSYHSGNGKPPFLCEQPAANPAAPPRMDQ
jgi:hypothetical protein